MMVGERIKEARRRAGIMTIDQFVKRSGLQDKQIRRYENGEHTPKAEALIAISQACDVSTDWLLLGRDDTPAAFFDWQEQHAVLEAAGF